MKPPIHSIGRCASRRIALSVWSSHSSSIALHFIFRRLESKLVFIFLLYQFINSVESLRPTPPPTPLPRRVCAGLGLTIKFVPLEVAEAHHDGVVCGRKNLLFLPTKTYGGIVFCSRPNTNRG